MLRFNRKVRKNAQRTSRLSTMRTSSGPSAPVGRSAARIRPSRPATTGARPDPAGVLIR